MVAPVVWTDGHWLVSYRGFCPFVGRLRTAKQICPKDPRPHIGSETRTIEGGSRFYAPVDLPDDVRVRVSRAARGSTGNPVTGSLPQSDSSHRRLPTGNLLTGSENAISCVLWDQRWDVSHE